ncbi:unnamed protein product [Brassicogethes aeneus]|uniref:Caspase-1 n=1 Tax=Brassicogethes aeneus TaxID=1431903 RepID=A0A9P0ALP2_BRAAE|nr:unnamed protein product [Brassicogethes aeneus]
MNSGVDEIGNNGQSNDTVDVNPINGANGENNDEGDALGSGGNSNGENYARMPVAKYASHYKMDFPEKSIAYIFNHETFQVHDLRKRAGTNRDSENLRKVLINLNFDVHEFKDLRHDELMQNLDHLAKMDHSKKSCIIVSVLSHGEMGIIYAKDTCYKPDDLWKNFTGDRCPSLAGKPKMFFIQACQGDKLDKGVNMIRTETDGESHHSYKIPVQADFLMMYSTYKGYYSWRNTTNGSWFIQALCEELRARSANDDLLTILTYVTQRVALDYESNTPDNSTMHRQKQIPCIMSMLTRLVRFNPGYGNH